MKKTLMGLAVFFTVIIIMAIYFFTTTTKPYYQDRNQTIKIAEAEAGLVEDFDFYAFHGKDESYYTVTGLDEEEEAIAVMVRESDGAIEIFDFNQLVSRQEAIQLVQEDLAIDQVLQARMGMTGGEQPIWEISFENNDGTIGYYYVSLLDGHWVRTIDNL